MPRNYPNLGSRVRLNPVSPSNNNTASIKDPEVIQEFEQKQRKQLDFKTIQISIESYKALQSMSTYFNMGSYDDIIITMVKHFKGCVNHEYGKYYDTTTSASD